MSLKKSRLAVVVSAALVASGAFALTACGGGVPSGDVAVITGEQNISKTGPNGFDHWLNIFARRSQPQPAPGQTQTQAATTPRPGTPEYNALRDQVMGFLISYYWFDGQAKEMDVKVTEADVNKQIDEAKKQFFQGDEKKFKEFLEQSGQTEKDLFFQSKRGLLQQKITEKVTKEAGKVTEADIKKYYDENKQQFGKPESRDVNAVLNKDKSKAEAAKKALESGDSWKAVCKKYTTDPALKSSNCKLENQTEGQLDKQFDKAVFSAKKGEIEGPVKTQFGYYVFEVTKIQKGSQTPLKEAQPQIKQLLEQQGSQEKLQKFGDEFQKQWLEKTECAKGFIVAELCKNAPKQDTTGTGAAPSGQGQAPQGGGAPPSGGSPSPGGGGSK